MVCSEKGNFGSYRWVSGSVAQPGRLGRVSALTRVEAEWNARSLSDMGIFVRDVAHG